jgi:hypothetical protein
LNNFAPFRNYVYDTSISGFNQLGTPDSEDDDMVGGGRGAAVRIAGMRIYGLVIKSGREGEIKATRLAMVLTGANAITRIEENSTKRRPRATMACSSNDQSTKD